MSGCDIKVGPVRGSNWKCGYGGNVLPWLFLMTICIYTYCTIIKLIVVIHFKESGVISNFICFAQVFVCSGKDGFVPKYKPDSEEYGCASDSGHLRAQYKILVSITTNTYIGLYKNMHICQSSNISSIT